MASKNLTSGRLCPVAHLKMTPFLKRIFALCHGMRTARPDRNPRHPKKLARQIVFKFSVKKLNAEGRRGKRNMMLRDPHSRPTPKRLAKRSRFFDPVHPCSFPGSSLKLSGNCSTRHFSLGSVRARMKSLTLSLSIILSLSLQAADKPAHSAVPPEPRSGG